MGRKKEGVAVMLSGRMQENLLQWKCKFENLLGKMQVKGNESYICGNICTSE